jgi:predicted SAM-dependent methyltransferase
MKLNLGSANQRIEGFLNVDALDWKGNTDIYQNLEKFPYPFADNSVEEVLMIESLEHISFKNTVNVLREIRRILVEGGKLHIQVPDCGRMAEAYCYDLISDKIPHKGDEKEILQIQKREGKSVHSNRWLFAFCGAQKHEFDFHKAIFTDQLLDVSLRVAGFVHIERIEDKLGWKLKFNAFK